MAYRLRKSAGFLLDSKGFDRMIENLSKEKRTPVLKAAMTKGAVIIRDSVRGKYSASKPNSDLYKGIVKYVYKSGEGAIVRRFYTKAGKSFQDKKSPLWRSYILNFWEKGTIQRLTKGKFGSRYPRQRLNRGALKGIRFFSKGVSSSKNKAYRNMENFVLRQIAKQARK